jgi:transposase
VQNDTLVAVDLAKSVFQVAVSHHPGQVSKNRRLSRTQFAEFLAQLPRATIVMEACGSAHFWARRMQALHHTPVLLSPHTVTPYVGRNKTDRNDTKGMLEAHRNEEIRPVPVKTLAQQALCSLHRIRAGWIAERTARINTLRGLLREFGIAIPVGAQHAVPNAWLHIEDAESELPDSIRPALAEICTEIRELERRIKMIETQLAALAAQTPAVARLMTIPGIGLIIATALVAFVGDIHRFPSARHFASYLGLTPKEHSTGSRRRLGAISKQGDVFLRTLLIHGARSVLNAATRHKTPDRLHAWALSRHAARGHNKAATAVANKIARIVWAVWKRDQPFHSVPVAA